MFEKYIIHDDVNPSQGVCLRFMFYSFYRDLESIDFFNIPQNLSTGYEHIIAKSYENDIT